jgi:hypothetical protein
VSRQRRELARTGRLVQREKKESQIAFVAETIEQGFKRTDVIGTRGDVGTLIAAEALMQLRVVIPERARMDLQHQPVLEAHLFAISVGICARNASASAAVAYL